jgi:tripartite-type tricarboxylate transporter receptor subunit TctC
VPALRLTCSLGTPAEVVHKLNIETNKPLKEKEFSDFLISQGTIPMEMSTSQFVELMQGDAARFRKIITELGIHID